MSTVLEAPKTDVPVERQQVFMRAIEIIKNAGWVQGAWMDDRRVCTGTAIALAALELGAVEEPTVGDDVMPEQRREYRIYRALYSFFGDDQADGDGDLLISAGDAAKVISWNDTKCDGAEGACDFLWDLANGHDMDMAIRYNSGDAEIL